MTNPDERDSQHHAANRWRDERPPSPRTLKLALIAAGIILIIGIVLYLKARHAPPALHDELQWQTAPFRGAPSDGSKASFIGHLFFA